MSDKEKLVLVNRYDLEILQTKAWEYDLRLDSTLKDHYKEIYKLRDTDLLIAMELSVSCKMVTTFIDVALSQEGEKVKLSVDEVQIVSNLLKMLNTAMELSFTCGTNLLRH